MHVKKTTKNKEKKTKQNTTKQTNLPLFLVQKQLQIILIVLVFFIWLLYFRDKTSIDCVCVFSLCKGYRS